MGERLYGALKANLEYFPLLTRLTANKASQMKTQEELYNRHF